MIGLGIGLGLGSNRGGAAPNPICDAIARKVAIVAVEKGKELTLAPHIVYNNAAGQPVLDAVVIGREGKKPNKYKMDSFPVADLSGIALTAATFAVSADFNPDEPRYAGRTVCVIALV